MASLASTLYAAYFAERHPDVTSKDFADLSPEARASWERVAAKANDAIQPALVGYRCVCGVDHMFEATHTAVDRLTRELAEAKSTAAHEAMRARFDAALDGERKRRSGIVVRPPISVVPANVTEEDMARLRSAVAHSTSGPLILDSLPTVDVDALARHVRDCPLGYHEGRLISFRSTSDAGVIAWLQKLKDLVTRVTPEAHAAAVEEYANAQPTSVVCEICGKLTRGGHERDGSDHCWGHDPDDQCARCGHHRDEHRGSVGCDGGGYGCICVTFREGRKLVVDQYITDAAALDAVREGREQLAAAAIEHAEIHARLVAFLRSEPDITQAILALPPVELVEWMDGAIRAVRGG